MESVVKNNEDKAQELLSSGNTTEIQETPASIQETVSDNGTSQNLAEDSTEGKVDADGRESHPGEMSNTEYDKGNTATEQAIDPESKQVSCPSLNGGRVDDNDVNMEVVEVAAPNSKKTGMAETCREICTEHDRIDDDDLTGKSNVNTESAGNTVASPRSPVSLSQTIPKKKRRRLEKEIFDDENDDNFINNNEDETSMPVDISLNELKRQVLGRDLKADDGEHDWEDEEDAEIRQIRALMNASNANANDHNPPESADTKDIEKGDTESNGVASTKTTTSSSSSLSEKLRKDLMCAICHEITYPPVALQCGHTFCQPCIDWWLDHDDAGRCPTCRRPSYPGSHEHKNRPAISTSPNLALRACIMAMFGPEIVLRLQNRKKLRPKGERGGAHNAGYQVLSEQRDEIWHYVAVGTNSGNSINPPSSSTTIQVRRSIVLDAEDQRMQLALAVYQKPIKEVRLLPNDGNGPRGHCGRFRVELCLLTMEEDEAVDSGFPTNIVSPEDEYFVCGGHNGSSRFQFSYVDVQMKDENGLVSPLARVSADANDGRFKYVLDPSDSAGNASTENIRALLFEHSETGSQLEIDLAQLQDRAGGSYMLPPNRNLPKTERNRREHYYSDEDFDNRRKLAMERHDDTEEDDKIGNQNEFEDDGFFIGDDESDVEGAFSDQEDGDDDEDEDDRCDICKDGGELMICDGGDKNPGCGKSFHAACVNRSTIPDGDWICQACAKAGGIETGIVGHEFREPEENADSKRDEQISESDASDDVDFSSVDDNSVAEGTFSDEEQKDSDSQEIRNLNDENGSVSQQQQDCEDNPVVKPSLKSSKNGTKRRFVLEDSDSD